MILRVVRKRIWRLLAACNARGECDLLDFLQAQQGDAIGEDKERMLALLRRVSESPTGPPKADDISHVVDREHEIWEFIRGRVRVLWFYEKGRVLILSHGFMKDTKKTPDAQLERARKLRKDYLKAKKADAITYVEESNGEDV